MTLEQQRRDLAEDMALLVARQYQHRGGAAGRAADVHDPSDPRNDSLP